VIVLPIDLPELNQRIIRDVQLRIPILEDPPLSNRSPEIDGMCRRFGVPLGSYWCALLAADVWADQGAMIPPIDDRRGWHPAKAETWRQWALAEGLFSHEPVHGAAVLYGTAGHEPAHHIGVAVASISPVLMDFEGNTSGAGFARNGELATLKVVDVDHLIGYVHPRAVS
jgi:hypothetical protein